MDTKAILKALDNDIRLQMLQWLKEPEKYFPPQGIHLPEGTDLNGGVCVGDIRDKVGITQSTASHYLDIMHKAGLVEPLRVGKWTYYRRNEETLREFAAFVQNEL